MKRFFMLLMTLVGFVTTLSAQDIIVKTNHDKIEAKVVEISTTDVRYKRYSNPDGPTYVLPIEHISRIDYQNGESDLFNALPEEQREAASDVVAEGDTAPSAPVAGSEALAVQPDREVVYRDKPELGRIYDDNGVVGIVIKLDDDGRHGLMVSLVESDGYLAWTTMREPYPDTGAVDKSDGRRNMVAVENYIARNGLSWDHFPAFKWCRELGDGWYLPAVDELLQLGFHFNGAQRVSYNRKARAEFNDLLKDNGGKKLNPMVDYYSSTYAGDGNAVTCTMEITPPYAHHRRPHEKYLVRAIRRF